MRIVLDANVLARAHQHGKGPAREVLLHVVSGPHALVLSRYLLQEVQRVLAYPRLLKKSDLTQSDITEYMEFLAEASSLVQPVAVPTGVLRDRSDDPVLGTAVSGKADVLCTRDADFFDEKVIHFSAALGIQILTDLELLTMLRS